MNTKIAVVIKRIVAVALVVAMSCPYAYASDIGKATYVEGRVDIAKAGSDVATPLREGDAIAIGDAIRTKSNSKAEVTFSDKSALRLAQNTRVEVKNYVLDENNNRKTAEIMVDRGKARTVIAKMPGLTEFNISTPNAMGTVHGSDVYTSFQAGSSSMLVTEGQLSIKNVGLPKDVLIVPAGNSVVVPSNEAPKGPRAYFELEKKLNEQDTAIPDVASRKATSSVVKGVVTAMSGDARITFKNTGETRKATINDIIGDGDIIETGANGLVEIKLDNGNGVNLKPDTKVEITKLVQDPKTGQYENRFSVSMGKVRARIEKVKETKSTFEVRTPTAICGARGTLMYVEIGPRITRCFFEGGWGDLASAISAMHREIEMGHAAYSDNAGNVFESYIPGEEERLDWTTGWEPGNGTEGYVSPGSTVGLGFTTVPTALPPTGTGLQGFFSDPLFPLGGGDVTGDTLTSSGSFYGDTGHYGYGGEYPMEGIVGIVNTFWNGGTATIESRGTYGAYDEPFVWFGEYNYDQYAMVEGDTINEGFLYSYNPDTQTYTTYDNGAFYGSAVGIAGGGIMDGIVRLLYIDPSGNAGIVKGILEGLASTGVYVFAGSIAGQEMAQNIGITAEDLYNSIFITDYSNGSLYGAANSGGASTGNISGNDRFNTFSIINHDTGKAEQWGIYQHIFSGSSYSGDLSSGWTGHVGGSDAIGAYFRIREGEGEDIRAMVSEDEGGASGYFNQDSGYWFMDISNGTWADNNFTADASGFFITRTKMGTMSGGLLGVYDDEGSWQGAGMGEWSGTPLKFVSEVYGSTYYPRSYASGSYYYYDTDGNTTGYYSYDWNDYYYYHYYGYQVGSTYYENQADHTYTYAYYYADGTYRVDVYDTTDGYWTMVSQTYGKWDSEDIESLIITPPGTGAVLQGEYFSSDRQHNGYVYGMLGGTDSLWGATPAAALFLAKYNDRSYYNTDKGVWTSHVYTRDYIRDRSTDYEGGAYTGLFSVAYMKSRAIGIFKAFYVDPDGGAGIMDGAFSGNNYTDINMIKLNGSIERDGRFPDGIGVTAGDLNNHTSSGGGGGTLISDTSNDWTVRGQEALDTMSLVDYDKGVASDWGIYAQNITGYYNGSVPQGWSAMMGGHDSFGITDPYVYGENADYNYSDGEYYYYYYYDNSHAYQYHYRNDGEKYYAYYYSDGTMQKYDYDKGYWTYGVWRVNGDEQLGDIVGVVPDLENATQNYINTWTTYDSDYGYWIADISEGTWSEGDLSADLNGRYISRTRLGTMSGVIRGLYEAFGNNGSWVGVGAGEWEGQDLSWVSNLGVSRNYYFGDYNNALMGSVEDLWSGTPGVVGMGNINNYNSSWNVWGSDDVYTHDYKTGADTAYSGGAFYGLLRGIVLDDGSLEGFFRAIYVDQSGNAGVMKGFIDDGAMYQDLGMFEFSGAITDRIQKISAELLGIAPEDLIDYVELSNNQSGYLYAVSEDGSYISGSDTFRTMSIADYDQNVAQNWGIYGQTLSGSYGLALLSEAVYGDGGELITPAVYGNLNSWSGHMGGNDSFGVYNPTKQYDGYGYYYNSHHGEDGIYHYRSGNYWYDYDANNKRGVAYWSQYNYDGDGSEGQPQVVSGFNYATYYYGDGTWVKIDNNNSTVLERGTWDPETQDLADILRRPPDWGTQSYNYFYDNGADITYGTDSGYWVATVETDPDWDTEGTFHAGLEGRFLTYTKTGTLSGEILGRYLSEGSWQGVGAGEWQGEFLSSVASFNSYYFSGLMGTTGSDWSVGSPVVMLGYYNYYGDYEGYGYYDRWYADGVRSHNYIDGSDTAYSGGAYYGFLRGVTHDGDMEGWFKGIYIDQAGNAGIATFDITSGTVYSDIDMFVADGVVSSIRQMAEASDIGLSANELASNVSDGSCGGAHIRGSGEGWSLDGYDGLSSYNLVNYSTGLAQTWGVYAQNLSGSYYNNNIPNGWSAKVASYEGIGSYNPTIRNSGTYYYTDGLGGSYYYEYTTNNAYGYYQYYRPASTDEGTREYYCVYYYGDGTTYRYDYDTRAETYGTWDPVTTSLSSLANPLGGYSGYWYSTYSYKTDSDDEGYYIGDISNGTWEDGRISADFNARFLTRTKMGTMAGKIIGVYDELYNYGDGYVQGDWYGAGVGDWEGEALSHVSVIDIDHDRATWEYIPHSWWYGYAYNYYWDWVHHYTYIDALMGGVDTLWTGQPSLTVMGQIYGEKPYPFVWQDKDVYSHNYLLDNGYSNRANTTYDGGSYSGNLIGSFAGNAAKAVFAALYIDPSGNAGAFLVNLAGTIYKNISSCDYFEMDSTSFYRSENSYTTDIFPGNLRGNLYTTSEGEGTLSGAFAGEDGSSGYINGSDTFVTTTLVSEDLGIAIPVGIYHQEISGSLYDPEGAGDFEAMMGGNDPIGAYLSKYTYEDETGQTVEEFDLQDDWGYWIADIDGALNSDGTLEAGLDGKFISRTKLGGIFGKILGVYSGSSWSGNGVGVWAGQALKFVSDIKLGFGEEGSYGALLGGTDSIWNNGALITIIGSGAAAITSPVTWTVSDPILSHDYINNTGTTYDGGAYYGAMSGVRTANAIRGLFGAIYVDNTGNGGIVTSILSGQNYDALGMFDMYGNIQSSPMGGVSISPSELNIISAGCGLIFGWDSFFTARIYDYASDTAYNWGIYTQYISGDYAGQGSISAVVGNNNFATTPTNLVFDIGYWIANLAGTVDGDGVLTADLINGRFMTHHEIGTLFGKVLGIVSENSWIGVGVGGWSSVPLSYASDVAINAGESQTNAILGGVGSLWQEIPGVVTVMGKIASYNGSAPRMWRSDTIQGVTYEEEPGAYYGYMGGLQTPEGMRGAFAALYIDPSGNAGIIWADLDGSYYAGIDMLEMAGEITRIQLAEDIGVSPEDLAVYTAGGEGILSGSFGGSGYINGSDSLNTYTIIDSDGVTQPWGIYTQMLGGSYDNQSVSGLFTAKMGGYDQFGTAATYDSGFSTDSSYWLADISGAFNSDGTVDGQLLGKFLGRITMGTLGGGIMGIYHPDLPESTTGSWEGIGMGAWSGEDLAYVSDVQTQVKSIALTATTGKYEAVYNIFGNSGNSQNRLTRDLEYYFFTDNSSGYKMDFNYTYNGQGVRSMSNGSYERTYYSDGTWTGRYWQGSSWRTNSGTWTGTLAGTIEVGLPTPDSNDTFTSSQTGGWSIAVTDTGTDFVTGIAGSVSDIVWGQSSPITVMGTISSSFAAGNVWSADIRSHNYIDGTDTTYDGGAYYGYMLGARPGTPDGLFVALYIDPADGDGVSRAGYLFGKLSGELYSDIGMFEASGNILATKMSDDIGLAPADLTAAGTTDVDSMIWSGAGEFSQGGAIVAMASGETMNITGEDWGIWAALIGGNYELPAGGITSQGWSAALSGESDNGVHVIGVINGNEWAADTGKIGGEFSGVYFAPGAGNAVHVGKAGGAVEGSYIEVEVGNGTWSAASAGEWVEVTDLLDQTKMFGANGLSELDRFVNVPVTEVYRNLLTSTACSGGITAATMNLNLYALDPNILNGIWTSIINGGYSGTVNPTGWSATVSGNGGATNVNIAGTQWQNNQWLANVTGTVDVNGSIVNITNGQAGGTYTNPDVSGAGTFTGVGAGTYQAQ